jgi:hypothetical protein
MKEIQYQQLPHKTLDRLSDEDDKQAPANGDNENLHE